MNKKDKSTAIVLALFLGGLGIHRFYLGRNATGIFYFLFCWSFIPLILSFLEVFMLLLMSDERFDEAYNQNWLRYQQSSKHSISSVEELEKLGVIYEKNLITREQFESKREELLKKIG